MRGWILCIGRYRYTAHDSFLARGEERIVIRLSGDVRSHADCVVSGGRSIKAFRRLRLSPSAFSSRVDHDEDDNCNDQ